MWYEEAVVYQIYPLGLCGAPLQNNVDGFCPYCGSDLQQ